MHARLVAAASWAAASRRSPRSLFSPARRSARPTGGRRRVGPARLRLARQAVPPPAPRPRVLRRPAHRDDAEGHAQRLPLRDRHLVPERHTGLRDARRRRPARVVPARDGRVIGRDGHTEFQYWHIRPAVANGQRVAPYRTVVGWAEAPWEHVHFSELRDGVYVNPLRPGALGPFADTTRPWIKQLRACRAVRRRVRRARRAARSSSSSRRTTRRRSPSPAAGAASRSRRRSSAGA